MYFRENSGESKRAYIIFHDVNSVLYMLTNIYTKAGIITVFHSENLAFFTVTSIHSIRKITENKLRDKMIVTGDSRLHKAQRNSSKGR